MPSLPPAPPPRRDDGAPALAKAHADLRAAQIESDRLREQIKGRDAHIAELKATVAGRSSEIETLRADLKTAQAELATLRDQQTAAAVVNEGDDLKRIRGIGPGYERTLKQHGVSTHAHIAAWTGDDILRIAAILKTQPGRIVRGTWIEQATVLIAPSPSSDA